MNARDVLIEAYIAGIKDDDGHLRLPADMARELAEFSADRVLAALQSVAPGRDVVIRPDGRLMALEETEFTLLGPDDSDEMVPLFRLRALPEEDK